MLKFLLDVGSASISICRLELFKEVTAILKCCFPSQLRQEACTSKYAGAAFQPSLPNFITFFEHHHLLQSK